MDSEITVLGGFIVVVLVVFGFFAFKSCQSDDAENKKFMAGCLTEHKEYECTAMWRAGESHTTVMPIPVIINH